MNLWIWLTLSALLSAIIAGLGYRRHSLSQSGVWGAILIGVAILGFGGWRAAVLLGFFFFSSSILSHFKKNQKQAVAEKFDKGHARDFGQTMANGSVAALAIGLSGAMVGIGGEPIGILGMIGALATATADTWATEIGTLSTQTPRSILNGRPVEPGTSGGLTVLGTGATILGALLIGLLGGVLYGSVTWWLLACLGLVAGLIGSLTDSFLGATVQGIYRCEVCGEETEARMHHDRPTRLLKGASWMTNDFVNWMATLMGAVVAIAGYLALR